MPDYESAFDFTLLSSINKVETWYISNISNIFWQRDIRDLRYQGFQSPYKKFYRKNAETKYQEKQLYQENFNWLLYFPSTDNAIVTWQKQLPELFYRERCFYKFRNKKSLFLIKLQALGLTFKASVSHDLKRLS